MPHDARSPFTPTAWTISDAHRGAVCGTASANVPRTVARTLNVVAWGPVMKIRRTERGVKFKEPIAMMPWGAKATWFYDPDGNEFFLAEG